MNIIHLKYNKLQIKMDIFIEKISKDFNLNQEELMSAWKTHDEEYTKLNKMKKPELLEICKTNNYNEKGPKSELVRSIINKVQSTPKPVKEKSVKKTINSTNTILDKIVKQTPTIVIKKNSYGNHEHIGTGFVFEHCTKRVYGKQTGDKVVTLTKEDIELCNKYNFKYEIPDSLGIDKNPKNEPETVDDIMEEALVVESDEESEEEIEYIV